MKIDISVPMHGYLKKFVHYKLNIPIDQKIDAHRPEGMLDFIRVHLMPVRLSSDEVKSPGSWNYDDYLNLKIKVKKGFVILCPSYVSGINNFVRRSLLDHLYVVAKFRLSNPNDIDEKKYIILQELDAMGIDTAEGNTAETLIRKVSELNKRRGEAPLIRERKKNVKNEDLQEKEAIIC